ncbi:MAG: outer membrane beta-barrel protein [Flavobacterium sp.]
MHKIITLLLLLAFSAAGYSQTITLKGKVTDTHDTPLEAATVYLTSAKDSSVVDYTISDKNGSWTLKTRKITQPVFLKVSFIGLADYRQQLDDAQTDRDFGTLKLEDKATELDEVVVKGEIPPIRIKKDTLEFNASSFKVRPDANVETLLKQLPGVDIDEEGKITVNGKEVNQILVNGKPFFDKDGKIALQNLPAEIIDKVQVTDTKTKKEEMTGEAASGNNSSINLTIQEDKNKGFFGRVTGGYGSDDRYESSLLLNYFKDKRKISILGSSNNINSTGFSMNEIFDNMRGGRNSSVYMSDDGTFGINGMNFGGGRGITKSHMLGANYADEWAKGVEPSFNYFFTAADTENENRTREQNLVPATDTEEARTLIRNAFSDSDNERFGHSANGDFEIKIDSTSNIYFAPRFSRSNSKFRSTSGQNTVDQNNLLQNESNADSFNESDNTSFNGNLEYFKALKRKGRSISVSLNNENRIDESRNRSRINSFFYEDANDDGITEVTSDIRNQLLKNRNSTDMYEIAAEYSEPITDSLRFTVEAKYRWEKDVNNRDAFDYSGLTNDYTFANEDLSYYAASTTRSFTPTAGLRLQKEKFSFSFTGGTRVADFSNYGTQLGNVFDFSRKYVLPSINGYVNYRFNKTMSASVHYNYRVDFPQPYHVLPIEDRSNPLSITTGNPDLDPNKYHSVYLSLYNYDFPTRTGYSIYAGGDYRDSEIATITRIDDAARYYNTYTNVSGTYQGWMGGNYSKSYKKDAHSLKASIGFNANFRKSKGFTNLQPYESTNISAGPRINLNYDYGELVSIVPTYSYSYSTTNFTNYIIDETSFFTHKIGLQTTTYWPKHVVFGNDFNYQYNSQLSDGFRKDFFLWNTSLGYNFMSDRLLFKVKVYDVLNQNLGTMRNVTPTSIRDEQNTVLKRYVMFSLTFKLSKFGGKETKDDGGFWWF